MPMTVIEKETYEAIKAACKEYTKKSRTIDWEQRRYEIVKDYVPYIMTHNPNFTASMCAKRAIDIANEIIVELQKK